MNTVGMERGRSPFTLWRAPFAIACLLLSGAATGQDAPPATSVGAQPAASKPLEPVFRRPPSAEYTQCANVCSATRDRVASQCAAADLPSKDKKIKPAECSDFGLASYQSCLAKCPVVSDSDTPM